MCEKPQINLRPAETTAHPATLPYPTKLFIEPTTRCNLQCRMCLKRTGAKHILEGDLAAPVFQALEPAFPHLRAVVFSGLGEPLLNPDLEHYIGRVRETMPSEGWIGLQTNGSLLDRRRALSLTAAGLDRICLSLDAVSPDLLGKMRPGAELQGFDRAFEALREAKANGGKPDLNVGVEFVLMRDNLPELPRVVRWAAKRGADFALVSHLLPYDRSLTPQSLYPPVTDAASDFFEAWKKKAEIKGLKIDNYFAITKGSFRKSVEDIKIVEFVDRMKAEALYRGLPLNLRLLIDNDDFTVRRTAEVIEEAAEVAREEGLRFHAPAALPRQRRRCEFVESGAAFISWEGLIHPCFFLWRPHACYIGERRKQVEPKVFGSLGETNILEIWNAEPFREFRKKVLRYDYAYCGGCNFAPCDLIQAPPFVQDCYTVDVPCGDCPWCQGLLECLR